jgi:Enoyl-CoA hydratase/isomerase
MMDDVTARKHSEPTGGRPADTAKSAPVAAKTAAIDAAQAHPLTWKTVVKRALAVAVAGAAIYRVLPSLIAVLGAWPRLSTLNPIWFTVALASELISFICNFALQRLALRTPGWFAVVTAGLAVPGAAGLRRRWHRRAVPGHPDLVADRIATITLSRPDQLNAFTQVMRDELIDAFDRADCDDDVRAAVVTGRDELFARAPTFLPAGTHLTPTGASDLGRRPRPSTACRGTVAVRHTRPRSCCQPRTRSPQRSPTIPPPLRLRPRVS